MHTANADNINTPDGGATDLDPVSRLRSLLLHPQRNFSESRSIPLEGLTTEIGSSTNAQPWFDERPTMDEREIRDWLTKLAHFELSLAAKCTAAIEIFRIRGATYASGYPEIAHLYVSQKENERQKSRRLASRLSEMAGARNISVKLSAQLFSRLEVECAGLDFQQMGKDHIKGDIEQTIHQTLLDVMACEGTAGTTVQPSHVPPPNKGLRCFLEQRRLST